MNAEAGKQRLIEAEATVLQALANARALVTQLEEENLGLRRQVAVKTIEIFTEREFAALCKVSAQTIAKLRRDGKIQPLKVGDQYRYTSVDHLQRVGEIFTARGKGR